jgi:hypothetical protein
MSKDRYYKHFELLKKFGYVIVKKRPTRGGGFSGNIYILPQNVSVPNGNREISDENPRPDQQDAICPEPQDAICPAGQDANNTSYQHHVNKPISPPSGGGETRTEKCQRKVDEIVEALDGSGMSEKLKAVIKSWLSYKEETKQQVSSSQLKALIKQVHQNVAKFGEDVCVEVIETCIASGYKGITWNIADKIASSNSTNTSNNSNNAPQRKKNKFNNFSGRERDYDKLMRLEKERVAREVAETYASEEPIPGTPEWREKRRKDKEAAEAAEREAAEIRKQKNLRWAAQLTPSLA